MKKTEEVKVTYKLRFEASGFCLGFYLLVASHSITLSTLLIHWLTLLHKLNIMLMLPFKFLREQKIKTIVTIRGKKKLKLSKNTMIYLYTPRKRFNLKKKRKSVGKSI